MEVPHEYIYLIQREDFVRDFRSIYKLGRTSREPHKRINQYPKGSLLLIQKLCSNSVECEKELLTLFKEKYKQMKTIGREYFSGDDQKMIDDIENIVKSKYKFGAAKGISEELRKDITTIDEETLVEENDTIRDTIFMGDPDFNLLDLGMKMDGVYTRMELLVMAKKCLVHVLRDNNGSSEWYGYYPSGIEPIYRNIDTWEYKSPSGKIIPLKELIRANMRLGFTVKTFDDIDNPNMISSGNKINSGNSPQISNPKFASGIPPAILHYVDKPFTHTFIMDKFSREGINNILCNTKLFTEYKTWKLESIKMLDENKNRELIERLSGDNINSSKAFTLTIPIGSDNDEHKIYRKEYGTRKWKVYMK